jgi:hypothetical protein
VQRSRRNLQQLSSLGDRQHIHCCVSGFVHSSTPEARNVLMRSRSFKRAWKPFSPGNITSVWRMLDRKQRRKRQTRHHRSGKWCSRPLARGHEHKTLRRKPIELISPTTQSCDICPLRRLAKPRRSLSSAPDRFRV